MLFHKALPIRDSLNWSNQKAQLKAKFPILTNADLNYEEGMKEEMLSNLQVKLAKARVQLNAVICWL